MYGIERIRECEYCANEFVLTCTESFFLECRCRNLTPNTISVYVERLCKLYDYLHTNNTELNAVCKHTLQDYILTTAQSVSPETVNGRLRVYRRFFNHLEEEGLITDNPMKRIRLLKTEHKIKRVLTRENMKSMLKSIDRSSFVGDRNHIMVLVLWDCMIRASELLGLRRSDIDFDSGIIYVRGKGRKQRIAPLSPKTAKHLHLFINKHKTKSDWAFCYQGGRQISNRQLGYIVEAIGKRVGLKVHPHLIRHSAATDFMAQGGNAAILQRLLGHSSLTTTDQYLHIDDRYLMSEGNRREI